jgi:GTP-binding protein
MRPTGAGKTRITFLAPSRGLIGYHGEFLTDTRGTGVMNRMFSGYAPYKGTVAGRMNGVLISNGQGTAVPYALWYLEERGKLFVVPGAKIYEGMIIGQHAKDNDLIVNPLRAKQLTNIRTTSKDEAVKLTPIVPMTLEQAIAYIEEDELVEVTPQSIRLRKRTLDPNLRKRQARADQDAG